MISIKGVNKKLGDKEVLKNINLHIEKGSIFGLIGPNGAGKTTLIKCLTGIYKIDAGDIKVCSENVDDNIDIKHHIGYVADQNDFFSYFKVKDVIKFYGMTYKNFSIARYNELNDKFKIPENIMVRKLSKGMKMRLAIMLNLSIMPKVLVLDEPTNGLDPMAKRETINILLEEVAERETIIFISSHNLSDLERICDKVAILFKGEIRYVNSVEEMKKTIKKIQVVFKDEAPADLENWAEVMNIEKIGRVYNIVTKNYNDEFKQRLDNSGISFREEIDMSLEDMFIYSIGGESGYEEIFK
ncbi:MAG: ABC transporter ATP-binding protein [Bacillota bacterium]|nr:ABC transporter ATP-binding protein [Bacillota bacterium]